MENFQLHTTQLVHPGDPSMDPNNTAQLLPTVRKSREPDASKALRAVPRRTPISPLGTLILE